MAAIKQPNSRNCFGCGLENASGLQIEYYDNGVDEVWCDYVIPKRFEGFPGIAHGGIAATILDEVCGRISMIANPNRFMMTVKMEVKYRRPVPVGAPIRVLGKIIRQRGRLAQARGELRLPSGELAVEAAMVLADLPDDVVRVEDGLLEELGWRVYD